MAKLTKRPEAVVVGKWRALPLMAAAPSGVTEVVSWSIISSEGGQVATVPDEQFQRDGKRMLTCYANGDAYVPTVELAGEMLAPEMAWHRRRDLLVNGRDQTLEVAPFTRSLAGAEADEEGVFRNALERHEVEQWPGLERELFATLFGGATARADVAPADAWLQKIHEQAEQLEEWQDLQRQCQGDPWASGIGAGRVTERLGKVLDEAIRKLAPQEDPERLQEEAEELDELTPGAGVLLAEQAQQAGLQAGALANELGREAVELKIRQTIRAASEEAEQELASVRSAVAGLGAGELGAVAAPAQEIRKALAADPKLRRVAEIAGRMRMRARKAQRARVEYLPEQIVDVTVGGEIERLLPSELTLLAGEETELLSIRRLIERQALEYRVEGHETLDRGPVILCVDGSGSMAGARNEWAMGVALAVLDVCRTQKRAFCLVHFDAVVQKTFEVAASRKLTLQQLVDMVGFFSGGGTNFEPPLDWATAHVGHGAWKRSDVILVTDGGGAWGDAVKRLKGLDASVYGVAIDTDFSPEQQKELAGVARIANLAEAKKKAPGQLQDAPVDLVFGI